MTSSLRIGERDFNWGVRTYVMGIINVTPDSFSGDGTFSQKDFVQASLKQARNFEEHGADILDIGGESTRPGAEQINAENEIERVIPVIEALKAELDLPITIDTYKAPVAAAAIRAGADMVNDVWACKGDPAMAALLASEGLPIILMHNRSKAANAQLEKNLGGRYVGVEYLNLMEDVKRELLESVKIALQAGIARENIILDPGIGFGKTVEQNLELLNRSHEIKAMGFPLLIGSSRKSFIGYTLDTQPEERIEGTAATVTIAIDRGADIIRVHDVKEMARVAQMTDALVRQTGN
jgi:dihydropteroate synthase